MQILRPTSSDLKDLPIVEPEVDKCIECGYCEHNCPSRDITLTPRQRIVMRREMQRLERRWRRRDARYDSLDHDFPYMALDTCAVDGLCALECPVSIDTGTLTKRFRSLASHQLCQFVRRPHRQKFWTRGDRRADSALLWTPRAKCLRTFHHGRNHKTS